MVRDPGNIFTATALNITGGTAPQEDSYNWIVNGLTMGTNKTLNIVDSFVGRIVSCEVTVAEPDGSDAVTKTAVYPTVIESGAIINTPTVLAPADGAGSGDARYLISDSIVDLEQTIVSQYINDDWHSTYTGSRFIAVSSSTNAPYSVMHSDNGTYWVPQELPIGLTGWNDVAYNGSRTIAVGTGTVKAMYSDDDGETWTAVTDAALALDLGCVTWVSEENKWLAMSSRKVYVSTDGITWTENANQTLTTETNNTSLWNGVVSNGAGIICAHGISKKSIQYSTDGGDSWKRGHTDDNATREVWRGIVWDGQRFCSSYGKGFAWSVNGTGWGTNKIVFTNGSTQGNQAAHVTYGLASDGVYRWVTTPNFSQIQNGGTVMMYAENDPTIVSNWKLVPNPSDLPGGTTMDYGNGVFVVIGLRDDTLQSTDALNWKRVAPLSSSTTLTVATDKDLSEMSGSLVMSDASDAPGPYAQTGYTPQHVNHCQC